MKGLEVGLRRIRTEDVRRRKRTVWWATNVKWRSGSEICGHGVFLLLCNLNGILSRCDLLIGSFCIPRFKQFLHACLV